MNAACTGLVLFAHWVAGAVMKVGLRVEAVVDFDAGEDGAQCVVSLRRLGEHLW